jgi:methylthioribulose-1-phosphate dehydratase
MSARPLQNDWPGWESAVDSVISAGKRAAQRAWVPATSGNLSVRADERQVAITRSGVDKGHLVTDDLLRQDLHQALLAGSSAEAALHLCIYREFDDIGAVFHIHSVAASVLGRVKAHLGVVELSGWELQKALAGVRSHETPVYLPVFDNTQDIDALAEVVAQRFAQKDAQTVLAPGYLIAGHGLYAWGKTADQAWIHLEALETLCQQILSLNSTKS